MTETEAEIEVRIKNAEWELKECGRDPDFFDLVLLNDSFQEAINKLFRTIRDWYPKLPSAARMQMLLRRVRNIKAIAQQSLAGRSGAQSGEATVTEGGEESVGTVTASTEAAE
eukprot:gene8087-10353_t